MTIHKPEKVHALTADERHAWLMNFGPAVYQTSAWRSKFARDAGVHRTTVQNWADKVAPVPAWAILLLIAWSEHPTLRATRADAAPRKSAASARRPPRASVQWS